MKKVLIGIMTIALAAAVLAGAALAFSEIGIINDRIGERAVEEIVFTVYTQKGEEPAVKVKTYTQSQLSTLASLSEEGYMYAKNGAWFGVVATKYVKLDALLENAGVEFKAGDHLKFEGYNGFKPETKPTFDELKAAKYYFTANGSKEVPVALALTWASGSFAGSGFHSVAAAAVNTGNVRFVYGITEGQYKDLTAAADRMPKGLISITIVTPAA